MTLAGGLDGGATQPGGDEAQAMFNRELTAYRKIVAANLMFHREVYGLLRTVLADEAPKPFRFLDIACGDASASSAALKGSAIGSYFGVDLSPLSLELAREALKDLPCPVQLLHADFSEAMESWGETIDVVWIGMSLHHLQPREKARLMKNVHDALSPDGLFMIWEPTLRKEESRAVWLDAFSALRSDWGAITDEEFSAMENHVRLADFPESADVWKAMGLDAGFVRAEQLFMMPNGLGRVFRYSG